MQNPAESQDNYDDEGPIWPEVKLTAYDRRRNEPRDLEAKRDAIQAKVELTDEDHRSLMILAPLIERAQLRFEKEGERARIDIWRKRRGVNDWRAGEGREKYNATRRKVRHHPNASLSALSEDQKIQHERDRRSDANFFNRRRKAGVPEPQIIAEYAERVQLRDEKRASTKVEAEQETTMQQDPLFGMF